MARPKPDRNKILAAISSHLLETGVAGASLRPMAAAANTTDRLLIYHFGNKEKLLFEVMEQLAIELATKLNNKISRTVFKNKNELINFVMELMQSAEFKPYAHIWLEIVANAARNQPAYVSVSRTITDIFYHWVSAHHSGSKDEVFEILTTIEGLMVLDAVNCLRFDKNTSRFIYK